MSEQIDALNLKLNEPSEEGYRYRLAYRYLVDAMRGKNDFSNHARPGMHQNHVPKFITLTTTDNTPAQVDVFSIEMMIQQEPPGKPVYCHIRTHSGMDVNALGTLKEIEKKIADARTVTVTAL